MAAEWNPDALCEANIVHHLYEAVNQLSKAEEATFGLTYATAKEVLYKRIHALKNEIRNTISSLMKSGQCQ